MLRDLPSSFRSWGSRVRIAPGSPLDFAHLDDSLLRALRIESPNLVENAIRPFVVGRKPWLFADTMAGARASANLYSLIETAKANRIEPWRYLNLIFEVLPTIDHARELEPLLRQSIDPKALRPG